MYVGLYVCGCIVPRQASSKSDASALEDEGYPELTGEGEVKEPRHSGSQILFGNTTYLVVVHVC